MMLTYPYTIKNPVTSTFSLTKLSPNRPYLLWWYAALVKGSESGQNNLQETFAKSPQNPLNSHPRHLGDFS